MHSLHTLLATQFINYLTNNTNFVMTIEIMYIVHINFDFYYSLTVLQSVHVFSSYQRNAFGMHSDICILNNPCLATKENFAKYLSVLLIFPLKNLVLKTMIYIKLINVTVELFIFSYIHKVNSSVDFNIWGPKSSV